jgi:hypothetical protein
VWELYRSVEGIQVAGIGSNLQSSAGHTFAPDFCIRSPGDVPPKTRRCSFVPLKEQFPLL